MVLHESDCIVGWKNGSPSRMVKRVQSSRSNLNDTRLRRCLQERTYITEFESLMQWKTLCEERETANIAGACQMCDSLVYFSIFFIAFLRSCYPYAHTLYLLSQTHHIGHQYGAGDGNICKWSDARGIEILFEPSVSKRFVEKSQTANLCRDLRYLLPSNLDKFNTTCLTTKQRHEIF